MGIQERVDLFSRPKTVELIYENSEKDSEKLDVNIGIEGVITVLKN